MSAEKTKRVLIECKDYSDPVGISVVRDFFGAVSQIRPDEAFVVTTKGFTREAIRFASDEGIHLVTLRAYDPLKDGDYIAKITVILKMIVANDFRIRSWLAIDQAELERVLPLISEKIGECERLDATVSYLYDMDGNPISSLSETLGPIQQQILNGFSMDEGTASGRWEFGRHYQVELAGHLVKVRGFDYEIAVTNITHRISVEAAHRIVQLIMCSLEGTVIKEVTSGELMAHVIDEKGEVIARSTADKSK